jgi:hypothetical protein
MKDKLSTRWFNPKELDAEEDIDFSTDFTCSEDELTYKRYKLMI